ncbi:hypothetical protein PR202_gb27806 [Eleusine coracana subsp. coracana]|uniref:TFIIS central domain-containing protein n=1 Tax=Eleusine coracana subsp. coracana TaxID=191504 RepID=A0AAV5FVG7_ELECO|nr:hypothetical protein PR202_gb27806 [Eleusine coracana subsp. coracana]
MELSKQAPARGTAAASRPSPSTSPHQSAQPTSQGTPYPSNRGARVPISEYLIVPMGGRDGASRPNAAHLSEARPATASRVSLRPPQQVMNFESASPGIFGSQPSPSATVKDMAASSKVQIQSKCSVQKEPMPKALLQSCESVRAKFRETLAAALGLDSDHLSGQQSALNVSPFGSADENKHAHDIIVGASQSTSKLNSERELNSGIDSRATGSLDESVPKRPKILDEVSGEKKGVIQNVQILPFRIEEELFKLFGGVNKKYREKGRSLLFNLKDKSNPVLREQVLSGDITPKLLCSMTIEELASKELSAWRLAKAEELAKMVVLPNTEVDIRRLVRKTHKGEFHVEVEESDGISVEVELGGDSLSHISKSTEGQTNSDNRASLHERDKESDNTLPDEVVGKGNSNLQSNLEECPGNEKAARVKECMLVDLKDTENLPGTMSLARFTEVLDSNLHYEHQCSEIALDGIPNKADIMTKPERYHMTEDKTSLSEFEFTCDASSPKEKCRSKIEPPKNVLVPSLCQARPKGDMLIKTTPKMMTCEKLDTTGDNMHSNATPDATLTHGSLWEGTIQFTLSSLTNVIAIFKSGEKPSTNDWSRFVEIKGRVKLTLFQEFLEQLPNSRRRAITVTELRWKEDSLESGRQHLLQTIDSYIADERVGLVKPAKWVDLYLCPCHGKAAQILAEHLPKEHLGSLPVTGEASVIGIVVWQRPHSSTRVPTRHDGSDCLSMPVSRKQRAVIASSVPMPSQLTKTPSSYLIHSNEHRHLNDNDDVSLSGAVPLGFGQCGIKHDDDLPEYKFVSVSNTSANVATSHASRSQQHVPAISRALDQVKQLVDKYGNRDVSSQPSSDGNDNQVRQLVHKYGNRYVSSQPWDDQDDDLLSPEQMRQLVHKYGDRHVLAQPRDGNDDELSSSHRARQRVQKYGSMYVSAQPGDGNDDDLRPTDQVRHLVHKYGNRYVSAHPGDGNDGDLQPTDQVRQLVHKYGNKHDPAEPWDRKDDELRPMDQLVQKYGNQYVSAEHDDDLRRSGEVTQLVHRYGMYSGHPWDNRHDDSPELYWDPIQSAHQRTWHPMLPAEYDRQRDHYYHRRHHLQEHYDGMLFHQQRDMECYTGPEQHVMAAQRRWNHESVMHPDETLGWRSNTDRHFVRQPYYFGLECNMVEPRPSWKFGGRRPWLGTWEPPHYM